MPVISTNTTVGIAAASNNPLYVLASGSIIAPAGAITSSSVSGTSFVVMGVVDVARFETGHSASLTLAETGFLQIRNSIGLGVGLVTSNTGLNNGANSVLIEGTLQSTANGMTVWGSSNIVNVTGTINARSSGINFLGNLANDLVNHGTIQARSGSAVLSQSGGLRVENHGTISSATLTALNLTDADMVLNTGRITAGSYGVVAADSNGTTITNTGTIKSFYEAVYMTGDFGRVTNTGAMISDSSLAVFDGSGHRLSNEGRMSGVTRGIQVTGSDFGLTNAGRIEVANGAALSFAGIEVTRHSITNSGVISGTTGIFIQASAGLSVVNSGTIQGSQEAMSILTSNPATPFSLTNTGTIFGDITVSTTGSVIVNSGTIHGDVTLSAAYDAFTNAGGQVLGRISGGNGSDSYDIDRDDLFLDEGAGLTDDIDAVYASVSYTLRANFEQLWLKGTQDLRGTGNDQANGIVGNAGDNRLTGLAGNDTIGGQGGDDTLLGGVGNDILDGGTGDDVMKGGAGADSLLGGEGDDIILGGFGRDTLTGGADGDTFVFLSVTESAGTQAAADFISDFLIGTDKIDLSAIDAKPGTAAEDAFAFIGGAAFTAAGQVHVIVAAGKTYVEVETTGDGIADMVIRIAGPATLGYGDLIL